MEFLGNVDHDKLPAYYAGADAHVSLSSFESFGLTVAESLSAGTPCVLKSATALQDWCGRDDVECVSDTDSDSVATAVRNVVEFSAPSESVGTWGDVTGEYESVYESIL
ncbi:hypothetical protein GCM10009019_20170 [Salarchaeum japonicum]|uniref:Glycosyl transferase family 1 domain-containing protein n=1 Tax=Salarchaeum japonicum TaxID=555573 RepID=A0AAV3T3K1_9EURY